MKGDMASERNIATKPFLDGGWGWAVMVASFLSQALIGSVYFGYGILLPEWMEEFKSSSAITSLIGSTVAGVISASGPVVSFIILKTSCRTTHVVGGIIIAFSTMGCSFANSMIQIFILYSILAGFGGGMCYISSVIVLSEYFKNKRSIAVGIAASGIGFGSFACPVIYEYLMSYYGWRGVMLIAGAINGNMIAFGMVMCPVKKAPGCSISRSGQSNSDLSTSSMMKTDVNHNFQNAEDIKHVHIETEQISSGTRERRNSFQLLQAWIRNPLARRKSSLGRMERQQIPRKSIVITDTIIEEDENFDDSDLLPNVEDRPKKRGYGGQICKLLMNPFFYILIFHNITMFFGMMIAFGLTPLRAVTDYSMTPQQGALLVSITGFSNLLGRFIWGITASSRRVNTTVLFLALRVTAGLLTLASPLARSFVLNAIYCALAGIAFGNWSIYPVVVGDQFGDALMTVAFGYLETANGIGGIIGPVVGGYLFDMSGTYQYSFIASGLSLIVGVIPFILLIVMKKICRNRRENLSDRISAVSTDL